VCQEEEIGARSSFDRGEPGFGGTLHDECTFILIDLWFRWQPGKSMPGLGIGSLDQPRPVNEPRRPNVRRKPAERTIVVGRASHVSEYVAVKRFASSAGF
jgi:hypothetical protein